MLEPVVEVRDLSFRYPGGRTDVLDRVSLAVAPAVRCLLVGPNGAGKSTLLRVLAGKHLVAESAVRVLGRAAFHDTGLADQVELLGGSFPFRVDVRVEDAVAAVRGVDPRRCHRLVDLLGVDLAWHMHRISDGERRRVQILLGLLRPSRLLLLDEVTTDLDLVARQDLLAFLRQESEQRQVTILYATHIFDTLEEWATHLAYMVAGRVAWFARVGDTEELAELRRRGVSSPLVHLVEGWLRRDAGR